MTLAAAGADPLVALGAVRTPSPVEPTPVTWGQFQENPDHDGAASASVRAPLKQAWKTSAPGTAGPAASGAVIGGTVAVAVSADRVFGVDLSTGSLAWQLDRAKGSISMPAVATSGGRTILVYTEGDTTSTAAVVAVDLGDPPRLWRRAL